MYRNDCLSLYCCSVSHLYPTLCDPMNISTLGFPVLPCPLELAQTHIHWVSDAIQPSHPLLPPSSLSCPQSFPASGSFPRSWLFASGGQSIALPASVLQMNIEGWCPLGLTGLISLLSKGPSRVFSNTTFRKRQFFSTQPSWWSSSHICTWLLERP